MNENENNDLRELQELPLLPLRGLNVFPGVLLTFASLRLLRIRLMREDFPTLDLPVKAISAGPSGGYCEGFTAAQMNSELLMIIPGPL